MSEKRMYIYGILYKEDHGYKAIIGLGPRKNNELRILRRKWPTDIDALRYLMNYFQHWWKLHPTGGKRTHRMFTSCRGDIISDHEISGEYQRI